MLEPLEKAELNQISLTGVRAIVLMGLLIERPRTLEEIRSSFFKYNLIESENSDDTIRVDLSTLKNIGCEISRADVKTNFKYELLKHPFALEAEMGEINILKKAYKKIKTTSSLELVLKYDELFRKIAGYISDINIREAMYGFSVFKNFDVGFVKELLNDCRENKVIKILYSTPSRKTNSEKIISAQKLFIQNDNIYIYGFDFIKEKTVVLNIKRIESVLSRNKYKGEFSKDSINVKFFLKNSALSKLEENEHIYETWIDGCVIEGEYYNEFIAMQRVLSLAFACTVIEPIDFRNKVLEKLRNMRDVYNGG